MNYSKHVLKSGREVELRPLTWPEYWDVTIAKAEISAEKDLPVVEYAKKSRTLREQSLALCVQGWPAMQNSISVAEVLEMEKIIDQISTLPVEEGNLPPASATMPMAGE